MPVVYFFFFQFIFSHFFFVRPMEEMVLFQQFVEKWNGLKFLWKRMNCNSEKKKCFYCSFLFNIYSLNFVFFFSSFFMSLRFVDFSLYIFFLSWKFYSLHSPLHFIRHTEKMIRRVGIIGSQDHSNERRELFEEYIVFEKSSEVKEKWYAQLLAVIYQIHCICSIYTQSLSLSVWERGRIDRLREREVE